MSAIMVDANDKVALCRDILETVLRLSLRCTDDVQERYPDRSSDDGICERLAAILLHMAAISGRSVLVLTEEVGLEVRDCFPIARSIVEACINAAYILAKGPGTALRAVRHAQQRGYRDLEREWSIGTTRIGVRWSGEIPEAVHEEMQRVVSEFTDRRGRELDWTSDNLRSRLQVIAERFPHGSSILLSTAAFMIYRTASEVSHGSLFGALYFWGLTCPRARERDVGDEFARTLDDHRFEVLIASIQSLGGAIECFAETIGADEVREAIGQELQRLWENPEIAAAASA
jgi:hypothetical protein